VGIVYNFTGDVARAARITANSIGRPGGADQFAKRLNSL
jgi:hypothetical protein